MVYFFNEFHKGLRVLLSGSLFAELLPTVFGFALHWGGLPCGQHTTTASWFSVLIVADTAPDVAFLGVLRVAGLGVGCEMHSSRCNDPDWEPLYEAVLLETDSSKLPERKLAP